MANNMACSFGAGNYNFCGDYLMSNAYTWEAAPFSASSNSWLAGPTLEQIKEVVKEAVMELMLEDRAAKKARKKRRNRAKRERIDG